MKGLLLIATMAAAALQAEPQTQTGVAGTIEGVVRKQGTAEGIPNVQVTLMSGSIARGAAATDNTGSFSFKDVPIGTYKVNAERNGFFNPSPSVDRTVAKVASAAATVVSGQPTSPIQLSLIAGGTIVGRVLNSSGLPAAGIIVRAYGQGYRSDGRREFAERRYAGAAMRPTDDRGEYRLFDLPPGEYYISATSNAGAYSRTFHPDVLDPSSALAVSVSAGGEAKADIRIPTLHTVKISGKVINTIPDLTKSTGAPASLNLIPAKLSAVEGLPPGFRNMASEADRAEGRFEIEGVLPGTYDLFGTAPSVWSNIFHGRTQVEVGDKDLDNIAVTIQPGVEVRIHLTFDGGASTFSPASVNPQLRPQENFTTIFDLAMMRPGEPFAPRRRAGEPAPEPLPLTDANGTFLFSYVARGNYTVQILGLPDSAYVVEMRVRGASEESGKLAVGDSPVNVEIFVNTHGTTIEGDVQSNVQGAAPNARVVLVPQGERHDNLTLYRSAVANSSGHFTLRGVAPGEYKMLAWESIPPNAHLNAEFLAKYERRAQIIHVTQGQSEASVKVIVE